MSNDITIVFEIIWEEHDANFEECSCCGDLMFLKSFYLFISCGLFQEYKDIVVCHHCIHKLDINAIP